MAPLRMSVTINDERQRKNALYDDYTFCNMPSNGTTVNVVFCDPDLHYHVSHTRSNGWTSTEAPFLPCRRFFSAKYNFGIFVSFCHLIPERIIDMFLYGILIIGCAVHNRLLEAAW